MTNIISLTRKDAFEDIIDELQSMNRSSQCPFKIGDELVYQPPRYISTRGRVIDIIDGFVMLRTADGEMKTYRWDNVSLRLKNSSD